MQALVEIELSPVSKWGVKALSLAQAVLVDLVLTSTLAEEVLVLLLVEAVLALALIEQEQVLTQVPKALTVASKQCV